jgi:hypothetical protein
LATPQQGEPSDVGPGEVAELRERSEDDDDQQLRQGHCGRHGHATVPAGDHDDERERDTCEQRKAVAENRAAARCADHHDDTAQRYGHRACRAPGEPLSQDDHAEAGGDEGSDGLQNQDVRDRGVVQRDDERGVGHGHGPGGQQSATPGYRRGQESAAPGYRRHGSGLRVRRVARERYEPEDTTPRDLGCRVDVQLTLQDPGGGPRHSRQHRVDHSQPAIADPPAVGGSLRLSLAFAVPVRGRAHFHVRGSAVTSDNPSP